jgi:hypothetical protein
VVVQGTLELLEVQDILVLKEMSDPQGQAVVKVHKVHKDL